LGDEKQRREKKMQFGAPQRKRMAFAYWFLVHKWANGLSRRAGLSQKVMEKMFLPPPPFFRNFRSHQ